MTERSHGLWRLLGAPSGYIAFQTLIGSDAALAALAKELIRAKPGDRIVDVGCGPARILDHLPEIDYWGFDHNESYITQARTRYGHRGRFFRELAGELPRVEADSVDIVMALGVLHHLSDAEVAAVMEFASRVLKPGGRFVSHDITREPGQPVVERFLVSMDRGRHVRTGAGYAALASRTFERVSLVMRPKLYRLPYTFALICAEKDSPALPSVKGSIESHIPA